MASKFDGMAPRDSAEPGIDDTAYLLNCYDVWSATPPGLLPCHPGEAMPAAGTAVPGEVCED